MSRLDIYKNQQGIGWARVDMLIALYDSAIQQLELASEALSANETARGKQLLLKSLRVVFGLKVGLNPEYGEVPERMGQLFEYVEHCITDGSPEKIKSALEVLATLRSAFDEIREQSIELERIGEIPPLHFDPAVEHVG